MKTTNDLVDPNRLKNLLEDMIDIYSPSGKEEQLQDFLHDYMKEQGLRVVRQELDENRYNLLVLPREAEDVEVVFVGHVDTVSAYELDDFGYEEIGGRVVGLGSADMKGGCAAMIEAFAAATANLKREPPVALALVVGEEEEGDGASRLLEEYHFPWAIIGEPTDLAACLGHFGYMEIELHTFGRRMHASLANKNENAIEVLLNGFLRLSRYMETLRPEMVYNIRDLYSASKGFAVSDRCETWLDIHMPPTSPMGTIATDLEEVFNSYCEKHPNVNANFKITTIDAGYQLPERGVVIESLQNVFSRLQIPWKTDTFRSHSDANQLWAAGVKPILLGPGRLEMAHTPSESISFQKVFMAANIYAELILELARERDGSNPLEFTRQT